MFNKTIFILHVDKYPTNIEENGIIPCPFNEGDEVSVLTGMTNSIRVVSKINRSISALRGAMLIQYSIFFKD